MVFRGVPSSAFLTVDLEQPGRQVGFLCIPHSPHDDAWGVTQVPIAVIGTGTGPTVLIEGGNHGDEYEGPIAICELIRELDPARVHGRLECLTAEGVTTVEIKSGYGLDRDTELRMLRVARRLGTRDDIDVVTSFLGAHALAPEYAGRPDAFIDFLAEEVLPDAVTEGLADMCDGGIEGLSIPHEAMLRLYAKAQALGLPARGHTDQYRDVGGAAALARIGARSADHLEYANEAGIAAMAQAGTVAMLLPGSTLFLRETKRPPVEAFRRQGVAMALATNCNPGSSPMLSPLLMLALGCTMFRMTPEEALRGYTVNAARVLGREDRIGMIAEGYQADLAVWDVADPAALCYWLGGNPCRQVVKAGKVVRERRA